MHTCGKESAGGEEQPELRGLQHRVDVHIGTAWLKLSFIISLESRLKVKLSSDPVLGYKKTDLGSTWKRK